MAPIFILLLMGLHTREEIMSTVRRWTSPVSPSLGGTGETRRRGNGADLVDPRAQRLGCRVRTETWVKMDDE